MCEKITDCSKLANHKGECEPKGELWCQGAQDALKRMGVFMEKHGVRDYDGDPLRDCTRP